PLGAAGRGGAALTGRAELRPLPRLPRPGRGVRPRHAGLPARLTAHGPRPATGPARPPPGQRSRPRSAATGASVSSAEQLLDVVGADPRLLVVVLAQLDVIEHVEVALRLAVLVQPDQRP